MFIKFLLFVASIYSVLSDDCVKYTFDENFELFSNDLDGCGHHQGSLAPWSYQTYTNTTVSAPNEKTNWFMSPSTSLSCISSFPFSMETSGIVEVYVYIDPTEREDHLAVMVHQIVDVGSHPVAGMGHLSGHSSPGWYVTKIGLTGQGRFNGYITFLGVAYPGTVLIVDSFRYIGPSSDPGVSCILYEDDIITTTIEITTPTILPSTTETIVPSTTETTVQSTTETIVPSTTEAIVPSTTETTVQSTTETTVQSTTETIVPSTTETIVPSTTETTVQSTTETIVPSTTETAELSTTQAQPPTTETTNQNTDCIKYTFEDDFEELFVENLPGCTNHQEPRASWSLQAYSNSTIDPPNGQSKFFITPSVAFSCTSSFYFPFMSGGLLEVLTYWESGPGNSLDIYVHAFVIGAVQALVRVQVLTPGWQVINIPLNVTGTFPMYLTFTGSRGFNSFIIVDSFRYVAPSLDPAAECVLYPDHNTTTLPTTTIPAITSDAIPITTDVPTLATEDVPITTSIPILTTELSTTDGKLTTTDIPTLMTEDVPTTTSTPILTTEPPTTDVPILTTTDTTNVDLDNPLEKIIIIKKRKTVQTESTIIKKIFRSKD